MLDCQGGNIGVDRIGYDQYLIYTQIPDKKERILSNSTPTCRHKSTSGVDFIFPCHKKEPTPSFYQRKWAYMFEFGGCPVGVGRIYEGCLKHVLRVSGGVLMVSGGFGGCPLNVWKMSEGCLNGVWRVSGLSLDGVWIISGTQIFFDPKLFWPKVLDKNRLDLKWFWIKVLWNPF